MSAVRARHRRLSFLSILPPRSLAFAAVKLQDSIVIASDHFVQIFEADSQLIDAVSRFLQVGIESGEVCVLVATPAHRQLIETMLCMRGVNLATLEANYQYIAVDAQSLLNEFFSDGRLDHVRFHDRVGMLLRQAAASGKPVRLFGEMVTLLMQSGNAPTVLELEEVWNELGRSHDFILFCGYPRSAFSGPQGGVTLDRISALHTHAVVALAS